MSCLAGWKQLTLADVCSLRGGAAFKPALQGQKTGRFPFIKVRDFNSSQNLIRIISADNWVNEPDTQHIQGKPVPIGTSVFAKIGEALKQNRVRQIIKPTFIDNNLMGAIPKIGVIEPDFLFQVLRTFDFAATNAGTAVPYLTAGTLGRQKVCIPAVLVQRRIASVLGAYDDLIEVNRRRIAVLEGMARGLFEEWFVRFRFPEHEAIRFVSMGDAQVPQGWQVQKIAEVASVNGNVLKSSSAPEMIGYIDISSVRTAMVDNVEWMSFGAAPGRARRRVKDGSIIWSTVRPNRCSYALLLDPAPDTIVSTGFAVLDAQALPFTYLFHAVTSEAFVGYLVGNATGAAYPAVTGAVFERASILVPPLDLAQRYADAAEPMLRLASKLKDANVRLAAARDHLLPRLISGELSVAAAEREVEDAA